MQGQRAWSASARFPAVGGSRVWSRCRPRVDPALRHAGIQSPTPSLIPPGKPLGGIPPDQALKRWTGSAMRTRPRCLTWGAAIERFLQESPSTLDGSREVSGGSSSGQSWTHCRENHVPAHARRRERLLHHRWRIGQSWSRPEPYVPTARHACGRRGQSTSGCWAERSA